MVDSLPGSGHAKPIHWVGSAKKDLAAFPGRARREVGFALYLAQLGMRAMQVKALRGFGGASVLEIVVEHESNAFRTVYTVAFPKAIYVLHAFQKKSKSGSATPRADVATIKRRFAAAVLANRQDTKGKSHDDGTN
jgi:phage-related protein